MIVYLAHGASGSAASMGPHVDGLRRRGVDAEAVALPIGRAESAVARYREQVADLPGAVIGGHSYGGRVASMLASSEPVRGLVLLSYPLHRPGHPEQIRTEHWTTIRCPVLVLSGESDPFAKVDLLRKAVDGLASAELHTYPGVGHGLGPVLDDALDRITDFAKGLG